MGQFFHRESVDTRSITPEELARRIAYSNYCIALTGAGASAESNVPTFRDVSSGIWRRHSMLKCGTVQGFKSAPDKLWKLIIDCIKVIDPKPNPTHLGLAKLEQLGKLKCIVTQNIDNLHQDAQSKNVIEFHGNLLGATCLKCQNKKRLSKTELRQPDFPTPLRCALCLGVMKPDVILFGESIPSHAAHTAYQEAAKCDLLLVMSPSTFLHKLGDTELLSRKSVTVQSRVSSFVNMQINPERTNLTGRASDYILLSK